MDNPLEIWFELEKARAEKEGRRFTTEDGANLLGVSRQTFQSWRSGLYVPDYRFHDQISEATGGMADCLKLMEWKLKNA